MRSAFLSAAVAALALGTARPADAQVYTTGGYVMPGTSWVYPASGYYGGFYTPGVSSYGFTYTTPYYGAGVYRPYYGAGVYRPYGSVWNTGYRSGYRPHHSVHPNYGRGWRR